MQPIHVHLSQKQKIFSKFFCVFFKSTSNFRHCQKQMTVIAYVFPKVRTPKEAVRKMSKKSCVTGSVDGQYSKRAETLFQSQLQHLYHIY